ncbi:hypothetical protein Aoki45_01670 [Algoriphagus sp. oki45]|nr:hypothetical protein Aoki45_01670 [Algoriphagus sp. oki45]
MILMPKHHEGFYPFPDFFHSFFGKRPFETFTFQNYQAFE